MLDPSVEFRGKTPGVTHKGTFNGNPLVAATGVAALSEIKTGTPNKLADAAAERLRTGMRKVIQQHQVAGARSMARPPRSISILAKGQRTARSPGWGPRKFAASTKAP